MDVVEEAIDLSLARLGVSCIDLLQFHWWQYLLRQLLIEKPTAIKISCYNISNVLYTAERCL
jgi:aryl-alcohol dehydrogenase-like predicted oxidoreductase